jgi:hypothetical protein
MDKKIVKIVVRGCLPAWRPRVSRQAPIEINADALLDQLAAMMSWTYGMSVMEM